MAATNTAVAKCCAIVGFLRHELSRHLCRRLPAQTRNAPGHSNARPRTRLVTCGSAPKRSNTPGRN
eukprot:3854564-Lingulodinium_polyedra.AAC.1